MMDNDWTEFCHGCKETLALIEDYYYTGKWKPASVLKQKARRMNIAAYCVGYQTDERGQMCGPLIVERLHPYYKAPEEWTLERLERVIRRIHARCPYCLYENPASQTLERSA
jgi:hypothetical protein